MSAHKLLAFALVLGTCAVAGSARAQFNECVPPSDVPGAVFNTIGVQAGFGFGGQPESVCNAIVKKGVATCKAQVKAAAQCYNRALEANYAIAAKQCKQLTDPVERAACKDSFQSDRDGGKAEVDGDKDLGLAACTGEFADALSAACLGLLE